MSLSDILSSRFLDLVLRFLDLDIRLIRHFWDINASFIEVFVDMPMNDRIRMTFTCKYVSKCVCSHDYRDTNVHWGHFEWFLALNAVIIVLLDINPMSIEEMGALLSGQELIFS